jgi:hypothetical protein
MRTCSASMALGLFMLLGAASADADLLALRADIPFSFQVGEATLPPGEYTFRLDGAELPNVLRVRGPKSVLILTWKAESPESTGDQPKLVFEKDGDRYVLSEVLDPGRYGVHVLNPRLQGEPERITVLTD